MTRSEIDVIRELLALRRAGAIAAVYCDAGNLRVVLNDGSVVGARRSSRYGLVLALVQARTAKAAA